MSLPGWSAPGPLRRPLDACTLPAKWRACLSSPCSQQAQLWNQQSLVIQVHGAALGNWAFLPHGAAAIQASSPTACALAAPRRVASWQAVSAAPATTAAADGQAHLPPPQVAFTRGLSENGYGLNLERDLRHVTNLTSIQLNVTDMHDVPLRSDLVFNQPAWQRLAPEQKASGPRVCRA